MDYLKLYDLERYLFEDVRGAFQANGKLSAFDFFCIIIWKANRVKSITAKRLLAQTEHKTDNLNSIVEALTSSIFVAKDDEERMRILIDDWKFRLPMASAILTVLYPDTFSVYDVRVCNFLGRHHDAQNKLYFNDKWTGYLAYLEDVKNNEPMESSLRDKDRILWAKSFEQQLISDISTWSADVVPPSLM